MAVSSLSAMYYSLIWDNFFVSNSSEYDLQSQNLPGFWWYMTAFVSGVNFIGIFHVRMWEVPEEKSQSDEENPTETTKLMKSANNSDPAPLKNVIDHDYASVEKEVCNFITANPLICFFVVKRSAVD